MQELNLKVSLAEAKIIGFLAQTTQEAISSLVANLQGQVNAQLNPPGPNAVVTVDAPKPSEPINVSELLKAAE